MKIKTFVISILIALFMIFELGCSKENLINGAYISLGDSVTTWPVDTFILHPYLRCNLILSKRQYEIGDTIKILFAVYPTIPNDAGQFPELELIFPNQEKLGIEIYKDSSLVFNYPKKIFDSKPDTLILSAFLHYNWNQIDNDSNQVQVGTYAIKAFLLHEYYSRFVEQKEFSIYK